MKAIKWIIWGGVVVMSHWTQAMEFGILDKVDEDALESVSPHALRMSEVKTDRCLGQVPLSKEPRTNSGQATGGVLEADNDRAGKNTKRATVTEAEILTLNTSIQRNISLIAQRGGFTTSPRDGLRELKARNAEVESLGRALSKCEADLFSAHSTIEKQAIALRSASDDIDKLRSELEKARKIQLADSELLKVRAQSELLKRDINESHEILSKVQGRGEEEPTCAVSLSSIESTPTDLVLFEFIKRVQSLMDANEALKNELKHEQARRRAEKVEVGERTFTLPRDHEMDILSEDHDGHTTGDK